MEVTLTSDMAADLRDDLLLDEITLNISPSKLWKVKQIVVTHRCKILLIGLVLLLSLALIASVCTIVFSQHTISANTAVCKKSKQPGPGEQKDFVAATREYQVTLFLNDWVNRTEGTIRYLNAMAAVSSLNLDISDITNYIHDEYQVDAKACHNKDLFRIRHYFYPENLAYNTTLGIKNNDDTFAKSYKEPNWPADKVFPRSFQKCEYDVHACFTKYSRESILNFPEYRLFTTCGDLAGMFPWAISVQNVELLLDTPQKLETVYWWLGKSVGYLNENTKYEIEFTLQYKTLEDAIAGNKKPEAGEWSIRIFALGDGLDPSHQFDSDGVAQAEAMWNALLDIFPEPCNNKN